MVTSYFNKDLLKEAITLSSPSCTCERIPPITDPVASVSTTKSQFGRGTPTFVQPGSVEMPFSDTTCPKYETDRLKKEHFLGFSFNFAV